jgi:hypothetical protein
MEIIPAPHWHQGLIAEIVQSTREGSIRDVTFVTMLARDLRKTRPVPSSTDLRCCAVPTYLIVQQIGLSFLAATHYDEPVSREALR